MLHFRTPFSDVEVGGQGLQPHKLGFNFRVTPPLYKKNKIASSENYNTKCYFSMDNYVNRAII